MGTKFSVLSREGSPPRPKNRRTARRTDRRSPDRSSRERFPGHDASGKAGRRARRQARFPRRASGDRGSWREARTIRQGEETRRAAKRRSIPACRREFRQGTFRLADARRDRRKTFGETAREGLREGLWKKASRCEISRFGRRAFASSRRFLRDPPCFLRRASRQNRKERRIPPRRKRIRSTGRGSGRSGRKNDPASSATKEAPEWNRGRECDRAWRR